MKTQRDIEPVNMTPMIDIVFQMIIFFVFTLDLEREKFDRDLQIPDAKDAKEITEFAPAAIYPQVLKDGTIKLGSSVMTDGTFRHIIQGAKKQYGTTNITVMIYAEGETPHRYIKNVMDICTEEKLHDIRVIGMLEKAN